MSIPSWLGVGEQQEESSSRKHGDSTTAAAPQGKTLALDFYFFTSRPSYRAGVAGEQRTTGVLAVLERQGYPILHWLPLSPRKNVDHLVFGPTGLFAINTKATTYEVAAKSAGTVYTDGYRQNWIESITRDAGIAAGYLATAAPMELDVRPLVAVWSTLRVNSASEVLTAGDDMARRITGREHLYPEAWVDVVFNVARRSDTWTVNR